MADVTLSAATRGNLLSLNRTTDLIDRTQERLSTGKKVNSAIDDALSFFKARSLSDRASDLATIKNNINQGINVIETAVKGLETIEDTLKQMKAIAEAANAETSQTERTNLKDQFDDLQDQLDHLSKDASFNGINLINTDQGLPQLEVVFSEADDARKITVDGTTFDSAGLSLSDTDVDLANWTSTTDSTYQAATETAMTQVDSALDDVRSKAREYGTNAALMEIRKDFTENMINTLESGAGQLVNADMNAESANMTSLQTRQQLGVISLSIAQQSEQAVLRLF